MQSITAQQSRDARRELSLSQADVTKALGFNRQYLSEFETGFSKRLTDAQLKKLRTFYETKIAEANTNGESITITFGDSSIQKSSTDNTANTSIDHENIHRTMLAVRHLTIDPKLSNTQIQAILEKIYIYDAEAEEALSQKAVRADFSDFDWRKKTEDSLKQVFGSFAASYVLMRHLQGRPMVILEQSVEKNNIKSVADLFANLFYAENRDLLTPIPVENEVETAEGAT